MYRVRLHQVTVVYKKALSSVYNITHIVHRATMGLVAGLNSCSGFYVDIILQHLNTFNMFNSSFKRSIINTLLVVW